MQLLCSSSPAPLLGSSVGAGCDGLVQLQVQRGRAELQATVAGPAHSAGLKQLLAWHWDLLVAAAGAEDVAAVPAGGRRQVRAALTQTLQPPRRFFTPFRSNKTSTGILFFKHERYHHTRQPRVSVYLELTRMSTLDAAGMRIYVEIKAVELKLK